MSYFKKSFHNFCKYLKFVYICGCKSDCCVSEGSMAAYAMANAKRARIDPVAMYKPELHYLDSDSAAVAVASNVHSGWRGLTYESHADKAQTFAGTDDCDTITHPNGCGRHINLVPENTALTGRVGSNYLITSLQITLNLSLWTTAVNGTTIFPTMPCVGYCIVVDKKPSGTTVPLHSAVFINANKNDPVDADMKLLMTARDRFRVLAKGIYSPFQLQNTAACGATEDTAGPTFAGPAPTSQAQTVITRFLKKSIKVQHDGGTDDTGSLESIKEGAIYLYYKVCGPGGGAGTEKWQCHVDACWRMRFYDI